jgi:hypothetical protein
MQFDLRTLTLIAGRPVATEVAIERLREIAQATFDETFSALNIDTLHRDPARFHAATRAVKAAFDALQSA